MKFHKIHISKNAISFKLVIIISSIIIPLLALQFYSNYYATKVVRNQVADSYKNMMSLYMGQIDNNLEDASQYIAYLGVFNFDLQIMSYISTDEYNYNLAKTRLTNKLNEDIRKIKSIDSIFIYTVSKQDYMETFSENLGY